jgi:DNA-directed RNA polymerase II subunit RPB1
MNAMMWIDTWDGIMPAPAIIKPRPLWTGKQLFSMICPKINFKGKSKVHDEKENNKHRVRTQAMQANITHHASSMPTTLHYTTLHYTTLHYTTLHYTTLHYTTLHTIHDTLHYTILHYTTLHYTTLYTIHYTLYTIHYTLHYFSPFVIPYTPHFCTHPQDPFNFLDSEVLIHSGELLQGIVDKNTVGTSAGSIVHITWLQMGWEETRSFMNQIQAIVNYWFCNISYTVSVSDTVADASTINNIQATLNEAKEKVKNIMTKSQIGKLKMMPGKPLMESFEMNINEVLNDARKTVGLAAQRTLKDRNAIKGTVLAGSKGSELNISQIIAW